VKITIGEIFISKKLTFVQLQELFKASFPFLSIEIYQKGVELEGYKRNETLESLSPLKKTSSFAINENLSVSDVIDLFARNLGITVGIFRKLGPSIVEASFTSKWSLGRQNKIGGEI
jgi:hypothetical protein